MEYGIIGTSVWQQNMLLLETLTLDRDNKQEKLLELKDALGVDELIYLSTCNRVEFLYTLKESKENSRILHRLIDFFFADNKEINFFPNDFYHYTEKEAITHLFRTVSSLESVVVGETQITGQFKDAYSEAIKYDIIGPHLNKLANEALSTAKIIKRETDIGSGHQSMASLAADEMKNYLAPTGNTIALIGAGEMTVKFARYITKENLGDIIFVNRTIEKAEKLAEEFGGRAIALADFKETTPAFTAIASATACKHAVFNCNFLSSLPKNEKPILVIDLAIPRDFCQEFNLSDKVNLVDIPALKAKANGNIRKKFVEAGKANNLIKEAVYNFVSGQLETSIKPIFHSTFKDSIQMAHKALDDLFEKKVKSVTEEEKLAIKNLVTKLIGNAAFQPSKILSNKMAHADTNLNFNSLNSDKETA
ncbi:MAG: glutamyl-tRNA reductase [Calditrichaeota bacterium]|nr:MAG: glutamyl-tRNA reductase [Calditrichota bacterium]